LCLLAGAHAAWRATGRQVTSCEVTFDGKSRKEKRRADALLVEQGLADSRARAQALILAGEVFCGDQRVEKAGAQLSMDSQLRVRDRQKFVSRGGSKLEGALEDLSFAVDGLRAADIGASTGGFTDCLLQHGALSVHAVDVGHGQLADKLRKDARVVVLEQTNARTLGVEQLGGAVDLVVVDASFISLDKLLPALFGICAPGGHLLALIKPQFEVGREEASRGGGVIRDEAVREAAVQKVLASVEVAGFVRLGDARCRVPGPKGNVEHFVLARRPP
jgi:23S rRNA (cytidine1920-2'-O)/16S rRNA (cytidine1409-2'-O)-methyltransferase